jgi:phage N-6-adenine-methyltransferase
MNTDLMFSSETDEWETPINTFKDLDREFNFTLDVSANDQNHKCDKYYTKEIDGLKQTWGKRSCWMNPPYGREIGKWVQKAYEESLKESTVVCLLPARTDTRWFHNYCVKGEIRFIKGRLKFGNCKHNAPFPNMIVIFKP